MQGLIRLQVPCAGPRDVQNLLEEGPHVFHAPAAAALGPAWLRAALHFAAAPLPAPAVPLASAHLPLSHPAHCDAPG